MNTKSKIILITDLALDGPAQLRVGIDNATVNDYALKYNEAFDEQGLDAAIKALGPIEVYMVTEGTVLVSGHHRVAAARQAGLEQLSARVTYGGTLVDAVKAAAKSNSQHGLPLNNADKRKAVNAVLDVDSSLGGVIVARLVGCSHQLVKNIKQERTKGVSNINAKRQAAKVEPEVEVEPEAASPFDVDEQDTGSVSDPYDEPSNGPEPELTPRERMMQAPVDEPSPEPARPPLSTVPTYNETVEVSADDPVDCAAQLAEVFDDLELLDLVSALQRIRNERIGEAARPTAPTTIGHLPSVTDLPMGLTGQGLEVLARKTTSGTVIYETWRDGERINPKARTSTSGRRYQWVVLSTRPPIKGEPYGIVSGTSKAMHNWADRDTDTTTRPIKVVFTF